MVIYDSAWLRKSLSPRAAAEVQVDIHNYRKVYMDADVQIASYSPGEILNDVTYADGYVPDDPVTVTFEDRVAALGDCAYEYIIKVHRQSLRRRGLGDPVFEFGPTEQNPIVRPVL